MLKSIPKSFRLLSTNFWSDNTENEGRRLTWPRFLLPLIALQENNDFLPAIAVVISFFFLAATSDLGGVDGAEASAASVRPSSSSLLPRRTESVERGMDLSLSLSLRSMRGGGVGPRDNVPPPLTFSLSFPSSSFLDNCTASLPIRGHTVKHKEIKKYNMRSIEYIYYTAVFIVC